MNNMQKAFKRKGLADGGRVSPHLLGTGMAARAGIALARRPHQLASALAAPAVAAPVTAPAGASGLSAIQDGAMPPRRLLLAQRSGMADGGVPKRKLNGGEVDGPGGPTDDKAGLFALSNDEYVLPADTVEAMGGPEVLDQIRDATHEFVDEKNRTGLVNGGAVWEKTKGVAGSVYDAGKRAASGLRAARAVPTPDVVSGGFSNAERAAATPAGYKTGGLAPAPNRALSAAKRIGSKIAAPLAVGAAVIDGMDEGSTARYAERFGVSEPTGDGSAGDVLKFAGLRAGGFATDLANKLTLGAAGNLYRDKPDGLLQFNGRTRPETAPAPAPAPTAAAPAPASVRSVRSALPAPSVLPDTGIRATSTRSDGKLNSFSGVGKVDPADYQAAVERAAADKARLVNLAASNVDGTAEGLDRAWRLASGDPEATVAVQNAIQQRGLRRAALNGDRQAAAILTQQGKDATDIEVANIGAAATERTGLARARADMAKTRADLLKEERAQRNADRNYGIQERTLSNAEGEQTRKNIQYALEGVLGPRVLKDGVPNPAYADFETKLNETLLQGVVGADGKPRTMQNLSAAELQDFLRAYQLEKASAPGALGKAVNFITGNSRPASNNLMTTAPRTGTAKEGLLYDTYEDGQGQIRRVGGLAGDDLTVEERRRVGLK